MSPKTLKVDEKHLYGYLGITVAAALLIAWVNSPESHGDLEARVQHLEAAVGAITCQCPEAEP